MSGAFMGLIRSVLEPLAAVFAPVENPELPVAKIVWIDLHNSVPAGVPDEEGVYDALDGIREMLRQ